MDGVSGGVMVILWVWVPVSEILALTDVVKLRDSDWDMDAVAVAVAVGGGVIVPLKVSDVLPL